MAETFESDEHQDPDDITPGEAFDVGLSTARGKKKAKDAIESDVFIPLFPDADKNPQNVIHELQIWKVSGPDDGYKGSVVPSSTLLQLARLYGNGVFNIHACRADGKILRRSQNVKLDMPNAVLTAVKAAPQGAAPIDLTLLKYQHETNEKAAERVTEMAREASAQSREQSSAHVKMVQETATATATRDREFFTGVMSTQQSFFSAMLAQSAQQHAHQMEQLRVSAENERIRQEAAHERQLQLSDPTTLISLFRQGLETGQGMNADDQSPITVIGNTVAAGLKEVRGMMALKQLSRPAARRSLPSKGSSAQSNPAPKLPKPATASALPPVEKLTKFRDLAEQKGLTVEEIIDQFLPQLESMPDAEYEEEVNESTSEPGTSEAPPA
jgi:hypothetical protein